MSLGPVGAWEVGGSCNELGGCGSESHANKPNKKPQTKLIWMPSGLNYSGMEKKRRVGTGCEAVSVCAGASEPVEIGAGRVGGPVEAGVVCGCRGTAIGRTRMVRHKLVGQGVLVVAVAAEYSLVAIELLPYSL